VALVSLATDLTYLTSTKRNGARGTALPLAGALAAKAAYARRHGLAFYLWLGAFEDRVLQGDRRGCAEASSSTGHAFKALALLGALRLRPALRAVVYADADATPARESVPPAFYLGLSGADVIGSANPGRPIARRAARKPPERPGARRRFDRDSVRRCSTAGS